jgi:orotate phosphoribosyltransferase
MLSDTLRSHLLGLLVQRSLDTNGNYTLASGLQSSTYVDAKLTTCFAEAMPLVGRAFLAKIRALGLTPRAVGGLTVGADPIAFAVARESLDNPPHINAFIVRKLPKDHGKQKFIEGIETTIDVPVLILDDVCTKGESTAMAIQRALEAGMKVLGAICLVDRQQGATELLSRDFGVELASIFTLAELVEGQKELEESRQTFASSW